MNTLTLEKHCWAEIDLTALRENYEYIRRTVGGPVCAVVKADAYGHGDNVIARVLQEAGAAGFAVSSLGEGRHLRRGGITTPILILGYADPTYAAVLAANDLITTCYSTEYAQALSAAAVKAGVKVKVHLKIDTGMGRIGFAVRSGFAETIRELEALYALPGLDICGVFQHFAVADSVEPDDVQVGVHSYYNVALGLFEPAVKCGAFAIVAAEFYSVHARVILAQVFDYLPRVVGAAVVHENYLITQVVGLCNLYYPVVKLREALFLVIKRYDYRNIHVFIAVSLISFKVSGAAWPAGRWAAILSAPRKC